MFAMYIKCLNQRVDNQNCVVAFPNEFSENYTAGALLFTGLIGPAPSVIFCDVE